MRLGVIKTLTVAS